MDLTTILGLRKPADADAFGQDDFNLNMDALDAATGVSRLTTAQRDALTVAQRPAGRMIWNLTTARHEANTGTAAVPVWSAVGGGGALTPIRKTGTTSISSDATLNDDPHLILPVIAGKFYFLRWVLIYDGGDSTQELLCAFSGPAGTFRLGGAGFSTDDLTIAASARSGLGDANDIAFGTVNGRRLATIEMYAAPSADGNITLRWCQSSSTAATLALDEGSHVKGFVI